MQKKVSALIAVRSGSVRVKNKNIRTFNGSTLLELKIKQLQSVKEINDVVVNSNSVDMLSLAKDLGAKTIKRDDYFASNTVSMSEVYRNMAEHMDCDTILYANCTNPLTEAKSYINAIHTFFENNDNHDSLVSCHDVKEFMYLDNSPLNYDPKNQPRSQDLPDIIALNFAISIISKSNMVKNGNIIGANPYFYKLNKIESIDIDTPLDFFVASKLYEYLTIEGNVLPS
jgi:CMP-N-acetylneuraminic acid synthetase